MNLPHTPTRARALDQRSNRCLGYFMALLWLVIIGRPGPAFDGKDRRKDRQALVVLLVISILNFDTSTPPMPPHTRAGRINAQATSRDCCPCSASLVFIALIPSSAELIEAKAELQWCFRKIPVFCRTTYAPRTHAQARSTHKMHKERCSVALLWIFSVTNSDGFDGNDRRKD